MTGKLELANERYTIHNGTVTPEDEDDPVQKARARYLNTVGPYWLEDAYRTDPNYAYIPDVDCMLASIIAKRLGGRSDCPPWDAPEPEPGTQQ